MSVGGHEDATPPRLKSNLPSCFEAAIEADTAMSPKIPANRANA
jgi:hypothetical protein